MEVHLTSVLILVLSSLAARGHATGYDWRHTYPVGYGPVTDWHSDCGGHLNGTNGVITSPNFPNKFPTPISCKWLIIAPPKKKIILYFTQFYVKEGFRLSEYDMYVTDKFYAGKNDLGEIKKEFPNFSTYKRYLLVRFRVREIGNIHLRVHDLHKDVYGFNITYEIVNEADDVREDACSAPKCSYLGECIASAKFETYKCNCYNEYWGAECEYGPFCDPTKGKNVCFNGGQCRYGSGPSVNYCLCPPAYADGDRCERKVEGYVDSECESIGCSQLCHKGSGNSTAHSCACEDGYRLAEDNKTCEEIGRMRFTCRILVLGLRTYRPHSNVTILSRIFSTRTIKRQVQAVFRGIGPIDGLKIIKLRPYRNATIIAFHFLSDTSARHYVKQTLISTVSSGYFANFSLLPSYGFKEEPGLHLISVQNYRQQTAKEMGFVTIVCSAKGSERLRFKWFKDGYPVDVAKTTRNMWLTRIPKTSDEIHRSILNIDDVDSIDRGYYMCQTSDWDEGENKTVYVRVIPVPTIELSPRTMAVPWGSKLSLVCVSRDDVNGLFKYVWARDGKRLHPHINQEVEENMIPTGKRLNIQSAHHSAAYTCTVSNSAGTSRQTATVTVLAGTDGANMCKPGRYQRIHWGVTAANGTDRQRCPVESDGNNLWSRGVASRRCVCSSGSQCVWEEPNFVDCKSDKMRELGKEFKSLMLGYQNTNISTILRKLKDFLFTKNKKKYIGDIELGSNILKELQIYREKFLPATLLDSKMDVMVDIASHLLTVSETTTEDERVSSKVGSHLMRFVTSFGKSIASRLLVGFEDSIITNNIALHMRKAKRHLVSFREIIQDSRDWSLEHGFGGAYRLGSQVRNMTANLTLSMVTVLYKNIEGVLPQTDFRRFHEQLHSRIVSVAVEVDWEGLEVNYKVPILITLEHLHNIVKKEQAACAMWRVSKFESLDGNWDMKSCVVTELGKNFTKCLCSEPGHYALVAPMPKVEPVGVEVKVVNAGTVISCIVALCGFGATLIVHIFFWREINGDIRVFPINICLIMIAVNSLFIGGLYQSDIEILCSTVVLLIQFFYLAAMSFLVVEIVRIYILSVRNITRHIQVYKYVAGGWVFPLVCLGLSIAVAEGIGTDKIGRNHCWLRPGTYSIYAFIVASVIVILVYSLFIGLVFRYMISNRYDHTRKDRKKLCFFLCRSLLIMSYLCASCIFSILYVNNTLPVYSYTFAIVNAGLGWLVFLVHCVLNKRVMKYFQVCLVSKCWDTGGAPDVTSVKSLDKTYEPTCRGFKSFVKPQFGDSAQSAEMGDYGLHLNEIKNQGKFTTAKLDQLVSLLGSSSDSSGGSKGSTISGTSGHSSENAPSQTTQLTDDSLSICNYRERSYSMDHWWMRLKKNPRKVIFEPVKSYIVVDDTEANCESIMQLPKTSETPSTSSSLPFDSSVESLPTKPMRFTRFSLPVRLEGTDSDEDDHQVKSRRRRPTPEMLIEREAYLNSFYSNENQDLPVTVNLPPDKRAMCNSQSLTKGDAGSTPLDASRLPLDTQADYTDAHPAGISYGRPTSNKRRRQRRSSLPKHIGWADIDETIVENERCSVHDSQSKPVR